MVCIQPCYLPYKGKTFDRPSTIITTYNTILIEKTSNNKIKESDCTKITIIVIR